MSNSEERDPVDAKIFKTAGICPSDDVWICDLHFNYPDKVYFKIMSGNWGEHDSYIAQQIKLFLKMKTKVKFRLEEKRHFYIDGIENVNLFKVAFGIIEEEQEATKIQKELVV